MAKRVIEIIDDDLDGSEAASTLKFGVDSTWYEIDLSDKNRKVFDDFIATYTENGRRTGGKVVAKKKSAVAAVPAAEAGGAVSATGGNATGYSNREIRDWARSNGWDLPSRGKLPVEVMTAFAAYKNGEAEGAAS